MSQRNLEIVFKKINFIIYCINLICLFNLDIM